MSLVRLRTFMEVYRQGSISSASRMLNLTQPAVSQHIAGLEVAVGRPLFERLATGVVPTSAGDELALDIGDKLDSAEAALASARARSMDVAGVLQFVGHADFIAEVLTGQLLPLLKAGIKVRMHTGDGVFITNMLVEGHCDLGISAHPVLDSRLKSEKIMTNRVLPVASPAVAKRIMDAPDFAAAITEEPMLAYNLELSLIDNWIVKNKLKGKQLVPAVVSQDLRAQRKLLIQGFGWSVVPEFLCAKQIKNNELVEIPSPVGTCEVHYYLIWAPSALRQVRVAHARQTLLQGLREYR
ncbi:LysR family transcriptional regulator [Psychromonas antarctica]|uniref:LysR family transcriptional regulator n=1 Tax=Psychromonas antarctica TaxID=67573 RepID=UPI001EE8D798|nr:LysR family transcriptional regulator [Psychromonas antarctica]MCG6202526.1 LysR family transcriptional regulator [Psychromonas antarctica]